MELGAQGEAARNSRRSPWTGSVPEAGKWGDSEQAGKGSKKLPDAQSQEACAWRWQEATRLNGITHCLLKVPEVVLQMKLAGNSQESNTCTVSSPLPPITTPAVGGSQIYSQVNTPSKLRIHPLLPRLFLSHLVSSTKASSPIFKGGKKRENFPWSCFPAN